MSGAVGGAGHAGEGSGCRASRAGARTGGLPGLLLLLEDSGVLGPAPEDLGAQPVPAAGAAARAAAPVSALVDAPEVPAGHVAGRTLPERMDARRDNVADGNDGNNKNHYHARYSLLPHARAPVALVPPFTRAGYRVPERVDHRRRYRGWISPPVPDHLHRVNHPRLDM